MAGWLLVFDGRGSGVDPDLWTRSLRLARRYGEQTKEFSRPSVALASWRRDHGEFPRSGRLSAASEGGQIAWVGHCLGDDGDATAHAIELLAEPCPSANDVAAINGYFAAAVLHASGDASVWTDRLRHYPVFVWSSAGLTVASTDARVLMPWLGRPAIDRETLDLFLRSGELIDDLTLVEGVRLLEPGSSLHLSGRHRVASRYFQLRADSDDRITIREAAPRIADRLRTAVRQVEHCGLRVGLPLSGGLDSRVLLGLCERPDRIPTFTWGEPACRDHRYAAAFAQLVNAPHRALGVDPAHFADCWHVGVDRTAGSFPVSDMSVLPHVETFREHCDAVINGFVGDAVLGGNWIRRYSWCHELDLDRLAGDAWNWRAPPGACCWADQLLTRHAEVGAGRGLWMRSIDARDEPRPIDRLVGWFVANRGFRFVNSGTLLLRHRVESLSPFVENRVLEEIIRVPARLRYRHRLFLAVLRHACPPAGRVRWQRTGLRPAWGYWPNVIAMAAHRAAHESLRRVGIRPFRGREFADTTAWLRGPWRQPAEQLLLHDRCLSRGVFDPDALRAMWKAHQDGDDLTRTIGATIAVESYCRMLEDDVAPDHDLSRRQDDRPADGSPRTPRTERDAAHHEIGRT